MPKFEKSKAANKKYSVITPSGLKLYSHLDHNDKKRREAYRARHEKVKTKDGTPAYKDKEHAAYYAYNFLWK